MRPPPEPASVRSCRTSTVDVRWPVGQDALDAFAGGAGAAASDDRFGGAVQIGDAARAVQDEEAVTDDLDARIAQRRDRVEHPVAEHRDRRDDGGAGEKKRREVDGAGGFAPRHENQVAKPRQHRGQDQDHRTLAIQIRRLDRLTDEDRQAHEEHAVGVDDVQPESRAAAGERVQRADGWRVIWPQNSPCHSLVQAVSSTMAATTPSCAPPAAQSPGRARRSRE